MNEAEIGIVFGQGLDFLLYPPPISLYQFVALGQDTFFYI